MDEASSRAITGFATWAATYDETVAAEVERYLGMPYHEVLRRVIEAAGVGPDAWVLDVGTGTGALALAIASQLSAGRLVGIDPTPEMLRRAQANAARAGLAGRIEWERARAEALPFCDASFDVVVSCIALHHTRVRDSVREMARVLKPGGCLAIADSGRNVKWETTLGGLVRPVLALYYLVSTRSLKMMRAELEAYGQLFLRHEWEAMLREAGFRQVSVEEFPHPTSQWYSSLLVVRACK